MQAIGATSCGVRALLKGPSGTGKTLAAQLLAGELGLELYRVDLSAVVNKYIGETEKQLACLFDRAAEVDAVLLFDEGDALFGRRTAVHNSTDRYANLETNFLLQRIEAHDGIVLLTTNLAEGIDSAFERRMDVVIDFGVPDAEQRLAIWELHLPLQHEVARDFLEDVAYRCALSGGQIRNAALHAALLALSTGAPLSAQHAAQAVQREYRKSGVGSPLRASERELLASVRQ
jgi:SpoVK/Ycf46/Vps4 family AAA+-type ATPase